MGTKHEIDNCTNCGRQFENADLISGKDLIVCRYCGHSQRNPYKVLTDKETEYLRRCNNGAVALQSYNFTLAEESFNQALEVYDGQEVSDSEMLEALWGLICSYYGIVFVKDYHEGAVKQIYCLFNLHQITPFDKKDEVNRLKSALNEVGNATIKAQYNKYMEDAENGIEQCILEQSKGYGYDYFIACKISRTTAENPNDNGITGESIEAKKLYNVLKSRGVKVFYSAIHYQSVSYDGPILSAMLRSDKMILICGSDNSEKYLKTPWVKSEWQRWRYMQKNFIKNGDSLEIFNIDESRRNKGLPPEIRDINQRFKTNENGGDVYADLINYYVEHSKSYREAEEAAEIAKAQKDKEDADRAAAAAQAETAENQRKIAELEKKLDALEKNAQAQAETAENQREIDELIEKINALNLNLQASSTVTREINHYETFDNVSTRCYSAEKLYKVKKYSEAISIWKDSKIECVWEEYGNLMTGRIPFSSSFNGSELTVESIKKGTKLVYINIPSSVRSIGKWVFKDQHSLIGINIPSSVSCMGEYAFYGCNSLVNLYIPSSVTSIGAGAFYGCSSLQRINMPTGVESICDGVFSDCSSLLNFNVPSSVTKIGDNAFSGCSSLNDVVLSSNMISMGAGAFSGCETLKSIEIPAGITKICHGVFSGCISLQSVGIPNTVTDIEDYAFYNCRSLEMVSISLNVTRIGTCAFSGCSAMTSLEIPPSVTSIGDCVFDGCKKTLQDETAKRIRQIHNDTKLKKANGLYEKENYCDAVILFKELAEDDTPMAQFYLGLCYENGQGVAQDYDEAVKWYRKAADQGNSNAQFNLGWCYDNGQGVTRDYAEAVKWYRKAADQGNSNAQNNLGLCYDNGHGVTQDYAEAAKWYRKAADQGDCGAQFNLGSCYLFGQGVEQNLQKGVELLQKAASQGDCNAQFYLGGCYYYGMGIEQSRSIAVQWYRKAADQGNKEAQFNLGWCYDNGQGVARDYAEAVKWYRKVAEEENCIAQYILGWSYENGRGISQDYSEAIRWYRAATEQVNCVAQNNRVARQDINYDRDENYSEEDWYHKIVNQGFDDIDNAFSKNAHDSIDADSFLDHCLYRIEKCRKETVYQNGCKYSGSNKIEDLEAGIDLFASISGFKDADQKIIVYQQKIDEIRAKEQYEREQRTISTKKTRKVLLSFFIAVLVVVVLLFTVVRPIWSTYYLVLPVALSILIVLCLAYFKTNRFGEPNEIDDCVFLPVLFLILLIVAVIVYSCQTMTNSTFAELPKVLSVPLGIIVGIAVGIFSAVVCLIGGGFWWPELIGDFSIVPPLYSVLLWCSIGLFLSFCAIIYSSDHKNQ